MGVGIIFKSSVCERLNERFFQAVRLPYLIGYLRQDASVTGNPSLIQKIVQQFKIVRVFPVPLNNLRHTAVFPLQLFHDPEHIVSDSLPMLI